MKSRCFILWFKTLKKHAVKPLYFSFVTWWILGQWKHFCKNADSSKYLSHSEITWKIRGFLIFCFWFLRLWLPSFHLRTISFLEKYLRTIYLAFNTILSSSLIWVSSLVDNSLFHFALNFFLVIHADCYRCRFTWTWYSWCWSCH